MAAAVNDPKSLDKMFPPEQPQGRADATPEQWWPDAPGDPAQPGSGPEDAPADVVRADFESGRWWSDD